MNVVVCGEVRGMSFRFSAVLNRAGYITALAGVCIGSQRHALIIEPPKPILLDDNPGNRGLDKLGKTIREFLDTSIATENADVTKKS